MNKICNVVLNSIWYDPRVIKQIDSYLKFGYDLNLIGVEDQRYDLEMLKKIQCKMNIIKLGSKYYRENRTIFTKIFRESKIFIGVFRSLLKCKPDIIHANDLNALIPCYIASKFTKSKLIFDSHEIFAENISYINRPIVKFFLNSIEGHIIKRCNLVICVSNSAADYFSKKYDIELPLVITNSVNPHKYIKKEKSKKFEVLNHGQFYKGRGYEIMAKSGQFLLNYPEIELVVRGFGQLKEEIEKLALEFSPKNFRLDPAVLPNQLVSYASQSFVGIAITENICDNFKFSVSNKLFEYTAAGLPVIMSKIPEHEYLNERYKIGLILREDTPEELSNAIIILYKNKELYDYFSTNAMIFSNELSWDNQFLKLQKIIMLWLK